MNDVIPRYPVFTRAQLKDNSIWIIMLIVLVIMFITAAVIFYASFRKRGFNSISRCEPGLCVVTYSTGTKLCPDSLTERLTFRAGLQGCSSSNYCQDEKAPCAVLPGGVLNCNGVCGTGNDNCACQAIPQ